MNAVSKTHIPPDKSVKLTALFIFSALISPLLSPAMANDTAVWEYPDGSCVALMAENRVQMVAETVDVRPVNDSVVSVEARFVLKNLTNEPVMITVGFPVENAWGGPDYEANLIDTAQVRNKLGFVSLVDGKEVPTRIRPEKQEGQTGSYRGRQRFFFVWDLSFKPGQRRALTTRYRTQWNHWIDVEGRAGYHFKYITTTGRSWAGKIQDALFTVRVPKSVPEPGISDSAIVSCWAIPQKGLDRAEDSVFVWHMRDWEPKKDLQLVFLGHMFSRGAMGEFSMASAILYGDVSVDSLQTKSKLKSFLEQYAMPLDVAAQCYINCVFALNGHMFSDSAKARLFSWNENYKPKKKLRLSELPKAHQKSIALAGQIKEEYEQSRQKTLSGPFGKFYTDIEVLFVYPPIWRFQKRGFVDYIRPQNPALWLRLVRKAFYVRAGEPIRDKQMRQFFEMMPWFHSYIQDEEYQGLDQESQAIVDEITQYMKEHGLE